MSDNPAAPHPGDNAITLRHRDRIHTRKALVAVAGIVAITSLMLTDHVDSSAGLAAITGITFYILGNGVAAYRGDNVQPVIRSTVTYGRRADD